MTNRKPMTQTTTADRKPTSAWRSPWVIAWISLVVIVLGVNATMVVLAITTNPGLVRDDYYEGGRDVERTIMTRLKAEHDLTMSIDTPADVQAEVPTTVRFVVVDAAGQPVSPDKVTYYAYRPSDAHLDFSTPMEQEAPGRYAARVTFSAAGAWDSLVEIDDGDGAISVAQRISVARP